SGPARLAAQVGLHGGYLQPRGYDQTLEVLTGVDRARRGDHTHIVDEHRVGELTDAEPHAGFRAVRERQAVKAEPIDHLSVLIRVSVADEQNVEPLVPGERFGNGDQLLTDRAVG